MSDGPANWEHDRAVNARRAREREKRILAVVEAARAASDLYKDIHDSQERVVLDRALLDFDLHENRNA